MPKVSIIVPVYKVEKYIRECLDGIKAQTFTDWECLLIDDGSPDNSGNICDEYAHIDPRFKVFHVKNGGVSRARNIGLDNMTGEWVMFVDSDDAIDTNTLKICLDEVERFSLDIVQFPFAREMANLGRSDNEQTDITCLEEYIRTQKFLVCVWGSLLRSSIIKEKNLRFQNHLKLAEDQIFMYNFFENAHRLKRIGIQLYWYRPNEGSATRNQKTEDIINSIEVLIDIRKSREYWRPVIDKVLTLFLIDIINNRDMNTANLVALVKHCDIRDCSLLTGTYRLFYILKNINIRLAICFVRKRYNN